MICTIWLSNYKKNTWAKVNKALKKALLNIYIWPTFVLVTLIGCLLIPFLLAINLIFFRRPMDSFFRRGVRIYGWILVRWVPFMAPVTLVDKSNGFKTPAIFVANHNSAVDPYLFGMLPVENAFVTTWPFRIPLYQHIMRLAGYINADKGWDHVLSEAKRLMSQGCSIIIWPEGHRSRDGKLTRFRNGAFQLACQTGYPIVPVCISGSFRLFPPGKRLLTPSRITMRIMPPMRPKKTGDDPEVIHALKKAVHNVFSTELYRTATVNQKINLQDSTVLNRQKDLIKQALQ